MIKKPTLRIEQQQPRNIQRADIAPANGYAMVVDGHFKRQFSKESAAKKRAGPGNPNKTISGISA
jgi:hypothetical protein